jgi:hypothetical protein
MNVKPSDNRPSRDPFMDEVHELKRAAAEDAGGDPERLLQQLQEIQQRHADRVRRPERDGHSEDAA